MSYDMSVALKKNTAGNIQLYKKYKYLRSLMTTTEKSNNKFHNVM